MASWHQNFMQSTEIECDSKHKTSTRAAGTALRVIGQRGATTRPQGAPLERHSVTRRPHGLPTRASEDHLDARVLKECGPGLAERARVLALYLEADGRSAARPHGQLRRLALGREGGHVSHEAVDIDVRL